MAITSADEPCGPTSFVAPLLVPPLLTFLLWLIAARLMDISWRMSVIASGMPPVVPLLWLVVSIR